MSIDIEIKNEDKATIKKIIEAIEIDMQALRKSNDDKAKGEIDTAYLRGEIRALKRVITALTKKEKQEMQVNAMRA